MEAFSAEKSIFYMSPTHGMYRCDIVEGSDPAGWKWTRIAANAILIADGGGPPVPSPPVPGPPEPPTQDPAIKHITAISKAVLRDKEDATIIAAVIDLIVKMNLSEKDFKEAFEIAISMADESLNTEKRLINWTKQTFAVSTDPAKMKAGLVVAFGVEQETLNSIETGEAIDFAKLIMVLQKIMELIELFKNFGKFGGGT